ncbi:MAG: DNA-processing protein DprA [Chloroflexota bacterium]
MLGIGPAGPLGDDRPVREPAARLEEREALAVLVSVEGLGPMTLGRLVEAAGSGRAVLDLARGPGGARAVAALSAGEGWDGRALEPGLAARVAAAGSDRHRILAGLAAANVEIVTIDDPTYPPRLRSIALPPHVLFLRGEAAAMTTPRSVAVVGTRRPTPAGRTIAGRIARLLVRAGASVVSGLAVGVDGAAHEAALREGGRTIAVIGSGHARLYPAAHDRLAAAIVDSGGAVVSEFAPDVHATKGTFPRRNRLISGLSEATIVVEAPARSGALTTAAWALEQGRGCFLVPGALDAPMSAGCLAFLREASAEARIVAGLPELLDDLGLSGAAGLSGGDRTSPPSVAGSGTWRRSGPSPEAVLQGLDSTPRRVAEALLAGAATVDELVALTSLPVATILAAITRLESADLVAGAYGRYVPTGGLAA